MKLFHESYNPNIYEVECIIALEAGKRSITSIISDIRAITGVTTIDITYTDEQLAGKAIELRNLRLSKTDWTQLPDVQLTEAQITAWRLYRQELRDITGQAGYPRTINWPVKPE